MILVIKPVALGNILFLFGLLVHEPAYLAALLIFLREVHRLCVGILHNVWILGRQSNDNLLIFCAISRPILRINIYLFLMPQDFGILPTYHKGWFYHVWTTLVTVVIVEQAERVFRPSFASDLEAVENNYFFNLLTIADHW
jgi:hypothetical protein